ncbi:MAG: class I SAM-dependent methyltransferase [Promethearchaeota archaeon]
MKSNLKIFPNLRSELEKAILPCSTLLDLGCGANSPIKYFSEKFQCIGIDLYEKSINESKKKKIHNEYCQMDVLKIEENFKPNSFDCVVALDLIEHLTKEDGNKLIRAMERISKKKVVIFTPNGYHPQGECDVNPWNVHKSGWTVEEMEQKGYRVIGMNGLKYLKGEYAAPRYKPKILWYIISELTQIFVRNHPKRANQLLCVKKK